MSYRGARACAVAAVTLLLGQMSPSASEAQTIITKQVTYFSVGGKTAAEIDREMMKRGPQVNEGTRHPGVTRIKFSGTATFVGKDGRCYIGGAKVTLLTKIMLPRWKNRRSASRPMALLWDTLSADIKRHEERHAEIARNHARDFEKDLLALRPERDCATLKMKVNALSQQAMIDHDADQKRFDRVEAVNFENRMIRLLRYRVQASENQ